MLRISILVAVVFLAGLSCELYAQDSGQKTRELVAALDKTKYKKKEKANISIEIYVDVKNEAVVRDNVSDYGGLYESQGYRLNLRVEKGGGATGEGYDTVGPDAKHVTFVLRDARIQGALLTGTKVYEGGASQNFEAVFTNRTVSTGKNASQIDTRETKFGLGFLQNGSGWTSRVFLERR